MNTFNFIGYYPHPFPSIYIASTNTMSQHFAPFDWVPNMARQSFLTSIIIYYLISLDINNLPPLYMTLIIIYLKINNLYHLWCQMVLVSLDTSVLTSNIKYYLSSLKSIVSFIFDVKHKIFPKLIRNQQSPSFLMLYTPQVSLKINNVPSLWDATCSQRPTISLIYEVKHLIFFIFIED